MNDDRGGYISHMISHVTHTCPLLICRHAGAGEAAYRSQRCQTQAGSV